MADTTFVDGVTSTAADWFNDLNRTHYTILGDPANAGDIVTALAASQSDMETATSNTKAVTPGRQQNHPAHPKAWVRFDASSGTPTVSASHNVSSLTDNGVGDTTVNFTTAFSSTTYAILVTCGAANSTPFFATAPLNTSPTASACRVGTFTQAGSLVDLGFVSCLFLGDQ